MRRGYVVGFVGLLVLAASAVVVAFRTDPESIAGRVDPNDLPFWRRRCRVPTSPTGGSAASR